MLMKKHTGLSSNPEQKSLNNNQPEQELQNLNQDGLQQQQVMHIQQQEPRNVPLIQPINPMKQSISVIRHQKNFKKGKSVIGINQLADNNKFSDELCVPLDIVLNCRFESGEYREEKNLDPIMVLKEEIKPPRAERFNVMSRIGSNVIQQAQITAFKEINEFEPYKQRNLEPQDGMLYRYSTGKGRLKNVGDNRREIHQKIQMLNVVTMYNEDRSLLERTLGGIQENLYGFQQLGIDPSQIVTVVIQDGIMKMNGTPQPPGYYYDDTDDQNEKEPYDFKQAMEVLPDIESVRGFFSEIDDELLKRKKQEYEEAHKTVWTRQILMAEEVQRYFRYKENKRIQRVKENNMLPPTIHKKSALLYQTNISIKEQRDIIEEQKDWDEEEVERFHKQKTNVDQRSKKKDPEGNPLSDMYCFFLNKHLNARKLSSHMWFFEGFCRLLQPKYCCLIDVGTQPTSMGIVSYFKSMEADDNIGGVSGFMGLYFDKEERKIALKKDQEMEQEINIEFQKQNKGICESFTHILWRFLVKLHRWVDVRKAQQFEYNFAHLLDKNFESFFNFTHVLPGAWSAYRYIALSKSQKFRESIIEKKYLKTALNPNDDYRDHKEENMFLAEDRILCLGIFCQQGCEYTLRYVPDAEANTDAVDDFEVFINQRRRWINSSWYALDYVLRNYNHYMEKSTHPWYRKYITIQFSMFVAWLGKINTYFIISMYYFTFHLSAYQILLPWMEEADWNPIFLTLPGLIPFFYVIFVFYLVFASLNFKANSRESRENTETFYVISAIFGIYQVLMFAFVMFGIVWNYILNAHGSLEDGKYFVDLMRPEDGSHEINRNFDNTASRNVSYIMIGLIIGTLGSLTLITFFHLFTHPIKVWQILLSTFSYIYYSAAYTHTLVIYSFCNIDDLSWGTKGQVGESGQTKYFNEKVSFVSLWLLSNAILAYILVIINDIWSDKGYVLVALGFYATIILLLKFVFALLHHLIYYIVPNNNKKVYTQMRDQMQEQFTKDLIDPNKQKNN